MNRLIPQLSSPVPRIIAVPVVLVSALAVVGCRGPTIIEVDPSVRFQEFLGWSATVEVGDSDFPQADVALIRDEMLDWVVDSLGITRLRLEVRSGDENPVDAGAAFLADFGEQERWSESWYTPENDNDDPFVAALDGFQFGFLDHRVETTVLPLKSRIEEAGERLYLNLNFVDFGITPFDHRGEPEEFAEFMLVTVQHLESKHGLVPDGIEILEPDNRGEWSATQVGEAFVAAGRRLEAAGYRIDFIGPSNISVAGALEYAGRMAEIPGIDRYWTDFSYHRYGRTRSADVAEVSRVASVRGMRTSMLEYLYATIDDLQEDLTVGNVSFWQKYSFLDYLDVGPEGRIGYRADTPQMSEYMRNIRPGATRVEATSSRRDHRPVAFVDSDGREVLLVRAQRGRPFTIVGLTNGSYESYMVLDGTYERIEIPLAMMEDGTLVGDLPRSGVLVVRTEAGPRPS